VKYEVLGEGQVRLVWSAVEGAGHYQILSAGKPGGTYELLADSRETEYVLSRLEPGTTVYVVVRAVREEAQSENSTEIAIEVQ
jgi:hypothetical protein